MTQAQQLYRLQQLDTEIRTKKQRLSEVIKAQRETEELRAARERAKRAAATLQKWQTRQNELNLELGTINQKAKRTEQRLYSGNVKNPKELADLQHELEALGRRRGVLEDDVIEAMIEFEEAQAEQEEADAQLAEIESAWQRSQDHLQVEQNELALNLHELLAVRKKQANGIDSGMLAIYDDIQQRKAGVAVAGLQGNVCLGCHVSLSANAVRQAERGELVYCGGCGRILNPL